MKMTPCVHTCPTRAIKAGKASTGKRSLGDCTQAQGKEKEIAPLPPLPVLLCQLEAEFSQLQVSSSEQGYISCRIRNGRRKHLSTPVIFGDPLNTHYPSFSQLYRKESLKGINSALCWVTGSGPARSGLPAATLLSSLTTFPFAPPARDSLAFLYPDHSTTRLNHRPFALLIPSV